MNLNYYNGSRYTQIFKEIKKVKNRYIQIYHRIYNSGEEFSLSLFDGNEWNSIIGKHDLIEEDASYFLTKEQFEKRYSELSKKAIELIKKMIW